jgi:hypothetical protein
MEEILKSLMLDTVIVCFLELFDAVTVSHSVVLFFIVIMSKSSFQRKVKTEENMMKNSYLILFFLSNKSRNY